MTDLGNLYSHLTNNSIAKHSEKFHKSEFEGCMWSQEDFRNHVDSIYGEGSEKEKVSEGIKNVVKWTLEAVQDSIENRKNSVELFGFDFMVDEQLNVWLLEVNSSPAMDYSTVSQMLET
jgi:tubulin monoglycylase TTLL3/8